MKRRMNRYRTNRAFSLFVPTPFVAAFFECVWPCAQKYLLPVLFSYSLFKESLNYFVKSALGLLTDHVAALGGKGKTRREIKKINSFSRTA